MLIRITDHCTMGCSHCMVEAGPDGEHMGLETFQKALRLNARIDLPFVLVSGGEPTDHPEILKILSMAKEQEFGAFLLSNGEFLLGQPDLAREIKKLVRGVQVTNDPRYYPRSVELPPDQHCDTLTTLAPFGRAKKAGVPYRRVSPFCFNLRSATRYYRDIKQAILYLRSISRLCVPSINPDGSVVAGEAPSCHRIGTVDSSITDLTRAVEGMQCNRCGLVDNLDLEHQQAIGEAQIIL